jgi:iron complex transport system permease protein
VSVVPDLAPRRARRPRRPGADGPRALVVGVVLGVVATLLVVVSVATGEFAIPLRDVVDALLGGGDRSTSYIVETLRLPRAVCALLVGAALGTAGGIFQRVTRNPLGSPDVVGLTSGAAAGAVAQIVFVDGGDTAAIALAALVGGAGTAVVVWLLALRGSDLVAGARLVLIGVGLSFVLIALTEWMLTRTTLQTAAQANVWITGSLNARGWENAVPVAIALAVLLPGALLLERRLRVLELGEQVAVGLGLGVRRAQGLLLLVAVGLASVAVSTTGPVLFVALAAPQIARRIAGTSVPTPVLSALTGAVLLLGADVLSQRAFGAERVPVGVVTGALGGTYLLWLLVSERRAGRV